MLLGFENRLADFIMANGLLGCPSGVPGTAGKVMLAVSGGADSMALLYAVHALKTEGFLEAELLCAHINHQLRGADGDLDEEFVVVQAAKLKSAVTTRRIDVRGFARLHKLSIETAARHLRMEALVDIAKANDCSLVATGHQKNDNAETIIQRLSRGTGFRGLAGIWPQRVFAGEIRFVRPLLCFRRDEIVEYLRQRNLEWRCDYTNADCTYRRNHIRHRLIPALQQDCTGSIVEELSRLAWSARRYYSVVCSRADELWPHMADCDDDETVLDLLLFTAEPEPVKVELIRRSLANIASGERYVSRTHYESILQMAKQNVSGKKIELPGGFVVRREYGNLIFSNCRVPLAPPILSGRMGSSYLRREFAHAVSVEIPGQTKFENSLIHATVVEKNKAGFERFKAAKTDSIEWFDMDKIEQPLLVRRRRPGDRFVPLGQTEEKKLGKFLTAQRVPYEVRRKVLVVADQEKIIWVWPARISEQSKITGETRKILQLQITKPDTQHSIALSITKETGEQI
jgi:tRNA(Ile)-lysidine synthase